jgi:hypothetical protein
MKSRDISAMPSASARVAKRIEAAGEALLIGAFCDKRARLRTGIAGAAANGNKRTPARLYARTVVAWTG